MDEEELCYRAGEVSRATKCAAFGGTGSLLMKIGILDDERYSLFWDVTWRRLVVRHRRFGIRYHGSSSPGKIS